MPTPRPPSPYTFGLETEFLLARRPSPDHPLQPLTYRDLRFADLEPLLPKDQGEFEEFDLEPPHRGLSPYLIEGYHWPAPGPESREILVKGIEIRTPKRPSIADTLHTFESLHRALHTQLAPHQLELIAIGHHPTARDFFAPRNGRRVDYWRWGLTAMNTYGPDLNLSPSHSHPDRHATWKRWSGPETQERIAHFGAALATFSWNSPFSQGVLWSPQYVPANAPSTLSPRPAPGHSLRTWRRSAVAPAVELHPEEDLRYEFKLWEMTPSSLDLVCGFLLVWTLLEHPTLLCTGETDLRTSLETSAVLGFLDAETRSRAAALLEALANEKTRILELEILHSDTSAASVLWDAALQRLTRRLEHARTPALDHSQSLQEALEARARWNPLANEILPR